MSTKADAARAVLDAYGIDPDALDRTVLGERLNAADGAIVAQALGEVGGEAAATMLRDVEPTLSVRATTKATRRALRRLAQRGVIVPPPLAPPPRAAAADPERSGLISAVDGSGDRLIWLLRALPSGARLLVAAYLNEPDGLRELNVAEVPRRDLRRGRERLERETGFRLVDAPFDVLDALVFEAWERAHPDGRRYDYPSVRRRFTAAAPRSPNEPASARMPPPAPDEIDALVADSAALVQEPEFAGWWPRGDAAGTVLDEFDTLEASPLVLGPDAEQQRLASIVRRATGTLYPPLVTARRLAGTAYVLAETGRGDAARRALAVAIWVRAHPEGIADVPLLHVLANRGLGRLLAQRHAERATERQAALVLTPDELRARSSSRPSRTRS